MRAIFLAFLFAALLPAETQLERGKRVVDEALAALGGEKNVRRGPELHAYFTRAERQRFAGP